jgi:ATP-dependent Clp protease ATP-binding subunit ClpA
MAREENAWGRKRLNSSDLLFSPPMPQRFTEAARVVMQVANQEATQAGHSYIGTADILIAIAAGLDGVAAQVLRSRGIDSSKIRSEVAKMPKVAFDDATPCAKKVIENAIKEAQQLNHTEMDSEHLLLGLLKDQTSLASSALVGLGVNLDQVRAEILSRLTPGSASKIAHRKSVEERFHDEPRVQALKQRIAQLQIGLEEAVAAMNFKRAGSFRDQRRAMERTLEELYTELGQGPH